MLFPKAVRILLTDWVHWSASGDAVFGVIFIWDAQCRMVKLRVSYRIYALTMILDALSYHTGADINPYTALPRHLLLAFPIFIGMAPAYRFRRLSSLTTLITCQELLLC